MNEKNNFKLEKEGTNAYQNTFCKHCNKKKLIFYFQNNFCLAFLRTLCYTGMKADDLPIISRGFLHKNKSDLQTAFQLVLYLFWILSKTKKNKNCLR